MTRGSLVLISFIMISGCKDDGNTRVTADPLPVGQVADPGPNNPFQGGNAPADDGNSGDASPAAALEKAVDQEIPVTYLADLEPLLVRNCMSCHSGEAPKGGLKLESFADAKAAVTRVTNSVKNKKMPPNASSLDKEKKAELEMLAELLATWQKDPSNLSENLTQVKDLTYTKIIGPLTDKVCAKCHGGDAPKAGLRLSTQADLENKIDAVIGAIQNGKMPPGLDPERRRRLLNIYEAWREKGSP